MMLTFSDTFPAKSLAAASIVDPLLNLSLVSNFQLPLLSVSTSTIVPPEEL